MNKEFIPYEQALELKELGFDEACICYYDIEDTHKLKPTPMKEEINSFRFNSVSTMVSAPLYQQAFRWFRENGYVNSIRSLSMFNHEYQIITGVHIDDVIFSDSYYTYEETELACLKKLIELIKYK